jgi:CelD/BcsL family acetyltransferase involved in cellulose biosynthesis
LPLETHLKTHKDARERKKERKKQNRLERLGGRFSVAINPSRPKVK